MLCLFAALLACVIPLLTSCRESSSSSRDNYFQIAAFYDRYYALSNDVDRAKVMKDLIGFIEANRESISDSYDIDYMLGLAYARLAIDSVSLSEDGVEKKRLKQVALATINKSPSLTSGALNWQQLSDIVEQADSEDKHKKAEQDAPSNR